MTEISDELLERLAKAAYEAWNISGVPWEAPIIRDNAFRRGKWEAIARAVWEPLEREWSAERVILWNTIRAREESLEKLQAEREFYKPQLDRLLRFARAQEAYEQLDMDGEEDAIDRACKELTMARNDLITHGDIEGDLWCV